MLTSSTKNNFQFFLLCLSSFLFFSSFNMIIPELPDYLAKLGGEEYIGLIIALFTVTAGLSRPFSGKLADKIGRIPVMVVGSVVCFFAGFLYPLVSSVAAFLFLRFLHGFSTGFKPTGTSAYVADLIPRHKRGEAMGILGFSSSTGMALGPALGGYVAVNYSTDVMFYLSSVFALISVLVLIGMKETLEPREKFRPALLKIKKSDVFEPRVIDAALVLMLSVFSFGVVLTLVPDLSTSLGIENKGLFFSYFTIASLFVRIIGGRASDKFGRVVMLKWSNLVLMIALVLIGFSATKFFFLFAAVIFGIGVGLNYPAIMAWAIDLSDENHRGRAMATVYIALEIGIGTGAVIAGWIYQGITSNLAFAFWTAALFSFLALIYLVFGLKKFKLTERLSAVQIKGVK